MASDEAPRRPTDIDLATLDVAVLVSLAAPAVEQHVLRQVQAAGHGTVRPVHGYVFQRLLEGPMSISRLADDLHVTQQRASVLVAELEGEGYVRRERSPGDARVRMVVLSDRGREVVDVARRLRAGVESGLQARVGDLAPLRAALVALLDMTTDLDDVVSRRVSIPPSG